MSEFNPIDVVVGRRLASEPMPAGSSEREPKDEGEFDPVRPEREGLPSHYRMRADAHYVEHVIARRQERATAAEASFRGSRIADRAVESGREPRREPADPRDERLRAELADGLATISSAAAMIAGDASPLARKVGVDLIRAEAWRAAWMLRAHAVLAGSHRARRQPQDPAAILDGVVRDLTAECRLNGVALEARSAAGTFSAALDGDALAVGIEGAVLWVLGHGPADGAMIVLALDGTDGRLESVEVSQEFGGVVPRADRAPSGRQATGDNWAATLGASAAKAVAELHGADAAFLAGDGRNTVRFVFQDRPRV